MQLVETFLAVAYLAVAHMAVTVALGRDLVLLGRCAYLPRDSYIHLLSLLFHLDSISVTSSWLMFWFVESSPSSLEWHLLLL